jgi:glycosyltransferase involved in cell wall biosynthesis
MKVSIITISFNQAAFLEQAIRSVVEQDHGDIEYIIVDAGSTDGSRDIIERYRDRIAAVVFEPDKGPADGLNKGFARTTGDILGYMNADDAYLPGAIGKAVAAFRARPDADVICGHGYIVDRDGTPTRRFRSDPFDARRYALGGVTVMQQSTFFRRAAFAAGGGFNVANKTSWDGELLLEMSLAGMGFAVVHEYWSIFRIHGESICGSQRMADESRRNWDRYFERVMGHPPGGGERWRKLLAQIDKRLHDPVGLWLRVWDGMLYQRRKIMTLGGFPF